jgi:hypothetical protein
MLKYLFLLCTGFLLLSSAEVQAQSLRLVEEPAVQQLIDKYVQYNKSQKKIDGWRIQFFASTDRRTMESTLRRMKNAYPDVKFVWTFNEPFYHVKAGAYAQRVDAIPLQYVLKKEFPGAFPVREELEVLELLENN